MSAGFCCTRSSSFGDGPDERVAAMELSRELHMTAIRVTLVVPPGSATPQSLMAVASVLESAAHAGEINTGYAYQLHRPGGKSLRLECVGSLHGLATLPPDAPKLDWDSESPLSVRGQLEKWQRDRSVRVATQQAIGQHVAAERFIISRLKVREATAKQDRDRFRERLTLSTQNEAAKSSQLKTRTEEKAVWEKSLIKIVEDGGGAAGVTALVQAERDQRWNGLLVEPGALNAEVANLGNVGGSLAGKVFLIRAPSSKGVPAVYEFRVGAGDGGAGIIDGELRERYPGPSLLLQKLTAGQSFASRSLAVRARHYGEIPGGVLDFFRQLSREQGRGGVSLQGNRVNLVAGGRAQPLLRAA